MRAARGLADARRVFGASGLTVVELSIAMALAVLVLAMAINWIISAQRTVSTSTAKSVNNEAAQSAVDLLDSDVRFASDLAVSSTGTSLFVINSSDSPAGEPSPTCEEWSFSNGSLIRSLLWAGASATDSTSSVATGLSQAVSSGVAQPIFAAAPSPYAGLVSVQFQLNQTGAAMDTTGAMVDETLSATNMPSAVPTDGTTAFCDL